ncbi:MAG: prephenate dehydrogenase [Saprospiraceae bacterium]|nr:prephenate dehydrogenase [Saprospiraceae bacterium]
MKITIIGLGLIGGSLAIALRKSGFATTLIGVEANKTNAARALELGLVDKIKPFTEGVKSADIVIVATPVNAMITVLPKVLGIVTHQIVMEVGSTKKPIVEAVRNHPKRANFIATHPMAGTEFSGPDAAISGLFMGKACVLCDIEDSSEAAHTTAKDLFTALQMRIVYLDADSHDVHTAYVSHISHISSFALALTVLEKERDENQIFELASGGFESTVRLAKSNPATWIPIFEQNRDNVLDVLDEHISVLSQFRTLLIKRNFDDFKTMIERANDIRRILK